MMLKQDANNNRLEISENEKKIKQLEKKLGKYGKLVYFGVEKTENDLKMSPNYKRIKNLAYRGQELSQDDWNSIHIIINEYFPGFYEFMLSHFDIHSVEYSICLLLRLHFKTREVANMLGVSSPYISNTCTRILRTIFEKKGSSKELSKELNKIF